MSDEIQAIANNNYILHNIDAQHRRQEALCSGTSIYC